MAVTTLIHDPAIKLWTMVECRRCNLNRKKQKQQVVHIFDWNNSKHTPSTTTNTMSG